MNKLTDKHSRPVLQWFTDAKFGIFIHWGPYSVPAWTPKDVALWPNKEAEKTCCFLFNNKKKH